MIGRLDTHAQWKTSLWPRCRQSDLQQNLSNAAIYEKTFGGTELEDGVKWEIHPKAFRFFFIRQSNKFIRKCCRQAYGGRN